MALTESVCMCVCM